MDKFPEPVSTHYFKRYITLIENAKKITFNGYVEIHHILPRSMGGLDDLDNLVRLPARWHYLAHYLLWKSYRSRKTCYAFHIMIHGDPNGKRYKIRSSRIYQNLIDEARKLNSGEGNPLYGKKKSVESIKSQSEKMRGRKQTKEHVEKRISKAKTHPNFGKSMSGKSHSADTRKLLSEAHKGKPKTEEHIRNMRNRPQDILKLECPHCKKIGDYKNMKRWHFNNCKLIPK